MSDRQTRHLRNYLLGTLPDAERDAIEHEYFDRAEALDRVSAAEDDLIDDYLSGLLGVEDREHFERHYLASPRHRTRVAVARSLTQRSSSAAASPASEQGEGWRSFAAILRGWSLPLRLAATAALLAVVAAGAWLTAPDPRRADIGPESTPTTQRPPVAPDQPSSVEATPPAPTVLALTLPPVQIRAPGVEQPTASLVAGIDIVRLELQEDPAAAPLRQGRVIVRTVDGREVARAPIVVDPESRAPAHVDVQAARLPPDDYIVELYESAAGVRDVERYRYFFRVR